MTRALLSRPIRLAGACLLAGAAALTFSSALRADEQPPPQLEDSTSSDLQKLQPLVDAKNWPAARDLLNGILSRVSADSYDRALVSNIAAKVAFEQDDVPTAVADWETCINLASAHPNYFVTKDVRDILLYLAQGYYQMGSKPKLPRAEEREYLGKSTTYVKRWIESAATANPTPPLDSRVNTQLFYADLLYSQAVIDEKHVDHELLQESADQAKIGLRLSIHPSEKLYQILVACAQQVGDLEAASHYLEFLAWKNPKDGQYWQNLWYCYEMLAGNSEKDPAKARTYTIRAINTQERAQTFGFMTKPRDNYNLFTLYYQVNQFGKATDILYKGLRENEEDRQNGVPADKRRGIDSTITNWTNLASAFQQNNQPEKAVDALKVAESAFPDNGNLDLQMGEIYYYQLNDNKDAYDRFVTATSKGHIEKPYQAWVFAAYTAYSLEEYKKALDAISHAESYPEAAKEKQLSILKRGVEENLKSEQDAAAAAKEAKTAAP